MGNFHAKNLSSFSAQKRGPTKNSGQKEPNDLLIACIPSHGVLQLLKVFIRSLVSRM